MITIRKDLFVVYCTSSLGCNMHFLDNTKNIKTSVCERGAASDLCASMAFVVCAMVVVRARRW